MQASTAGTQALAQQVANFFFVEGRLKQVFDTQKDDEQALRKAIKTATDAGLTRDSSRILKRVQEHLRQVILCMRVGTY